MLLTTLVWTIVWSVKLDFTCTFRGTVILVLLAPKRGQRGWTIVQVANKENMSNNRQVRIRVKIAVQVNIKISGIRAVASAVQKGM